jgi:bacillithiol biosynthesis cysteine-adding enzyme BshC
MTEHTARQKEHSGECYPLSIVPGLSRLFLDYATGEQPLAPFYTASPCGQRWGAAAEAPALSEDHRNTLADLLLAQNHACHAGPQAVANIELLRSGARAIVTGQQVSLFGGPLYTLHKAATAVRLAAQASEATGVPHVPIFWLATEDHDFAEADHVRLSGRHALVTIRLEHAQKDSGAPAGSLRLGPGIHAALDEAAELIGGTAQFALLERCYRPDATFSNAFAQWIAATFREQGLIVIDAAGRPCHALGREILRAALTRADELEQALLARGNELTERGYHAQVLVSPGNSLLFLLEGAGGEGLHRRLPLKRKDVNHWTAGRESYTTEHLLAILDEEPERLSPNALLRPVFEDALLPTAAYIGGPAETAYFAQTAVLYERILGRITPVLPRLSATLIDEQTAAMLDSCELPLADIFASQPTELTQRMGARAMPVEGKRRLAAVGNALDEELTALTSWMRALDDNLGRTADVAGSKMRYQMNRLRRLAANYQLERDASIARKVAALVYSIYPERHLQERAVGAASALARYGEALPSILVAAASQPCPGHKALYL